MLLINRDGLDVDLPLLDAAVNELRNARFSPHWPKVSASPSSTTRWRNRKRASFLIYCALSQRDDAETSVVAQGAADDQVSDLQARMTNCGIVYERCGPRAALSLLRRRSIIPTIPRIAIRSSPQ